MKTVTIILLMLMVALLNSCNLFETNQQNTPPVSSYTLDSLLLVKQTEAVMLSIILIDDISGSYTLNPESRNTDILFKLFKTHKGRELLGYTTITEDSYTPIIRLSYLDYPNQSSSKPNMWIDKQVNNYYTEQHLSQMIDSLNSVEVEKFNENVKVKLDRPVARKSDVMLALQRGSTFLNESPKANKIMIVCSDFKDTFRRTIDLDTSIQLFIVGHAPPDDVKRVTGRIPGSYSMFESYEEAFNRIVQMYNY